ncbi:hypothetical protein L618_001200000260 [Rhodococcus rhodochrous J45]|uniref:Uncharacterized protein n=1 Tax=Rhodococcus rhodochrous J45 TaxID=935266 RepID=A0A562ENR0_RHORH|nr:hypothetical protein L618_001200000260 [Rhodococcus rhodochrous J45]
MDSGCAFGHARFSENRRSRSGASSSATHEGDHAPRGEPQRGLDGVGEALLGTGLDGEAVDDDLDVVLLLLLQLRRIRQGVDDPVDAHTGVALDGQLLEEIDELALAGAHDGCEDLEAGPGLHLEHLVDDLLRRLPGDLLTADRAVRGAGTRIEQTQVVVDLGDGADGGPRVAVGGLLVDRHRGRQALDEVDVRLVHLSEELASVGRQRLDVAPLPLGEDGVEREARLARTRQSGENDQTVARQVQVDTTQVVFPGSTHDQAVCHATSFL